MILTKTQLSQITQENREKLLHALYSIEDNLCYECKNVSETINYIQDKYISNKVNYKDRVELATNYLKDHDYLIEEEEWLLGLLEGNHNGSTY